MSPQIEARGVRDRRVLSGVLRVLRHQVVPEDLVHFAYEHSPLPKSLTK